MRATSAKILLQGLWNEAPEKIQITDVVTDNRHVKQGNVFVAIKGERTDGHLFAEDALKKGAALVVAQHAIENVPSQKIVVVDDVLDAMIRMGKNYRNMFSPLLLAVTGSVGKTTTKEFCAAIFSEFGETVKTEGNQNNELGMPKTLFRVSNSTRYAVIEMGMQGLGEIRKLTMAAKPTCAIITKIGQMHLETLGSVENVLKAKMEISEGLCKGSPLVLNADDEMLWKAQKPKNVKVVTAGIANSECDVLGKNIQKHKDGLKFTIVDKQYGTHDAFIPTIGKHNVQNALLAYTAATRMGLGSVQVARSLERYVAAQNRQKIEMVHGVTLMEDFYNAGPDSMKAAIETLAEIECGGKHIAVLGDMLELGAVRKDAHRKLGKFAAKNGVKILITVGELASLIAEEAKKSGVEVHVCTNNKRAAEKLTQIAQSGDAVLIKASRGMKFEEILEKFVNG